MSNYRTAAYVLVHQLAEESTELVFQINDAGPVQGKESVLQHRKKRLAATRMSDDLNAIIDEADRFGFVDDFVAKQFSDYVNYNKEMLVDLLERQLNIKETDPCHALLVIAKKKIEEGDYREEEQDIKTNIRRIKPKNINYFAK